MNPALKELIVKAFEKARGSGKPDWHRMTVAVLKNRLLQLTQGAFREAEYGYKSINELVGDADDFLRVDKTHSPSIVELVSEQAAHPAPTPYRLSVDRIRPDLWQAIMDYSSGNQYVWDRDKNAARVRTAEDPPALLMPTIDAGIDAAWRKDFVENYAGDMSEFAKGRMKVFVEHEVSPKVLPHSVLVKWNEYIKARILDTLTRWFEDRKIPAPDRLLVSVRRPPRIAREDEIEQLRELIVRSVRGMTPQELAAVSLPPSAVLRVRKDKSGT